MKFSLEQHPVVSFIICETADKVTGEPYREIIAINGSFHKRLAKDVYHMIRMENFTYGERAAKDLFDYYYTKYADDKKKMATLYRVNGDLYAIADDGVAYMYDFGKWRVRTRDKALIQKSGKKIGRKSIILKKQVRRIKK